MRRLLWVLVLSCGSVAYGQTELKPDEIKKMYDDALVRMKDAQERKNALAAQLADVQKQLDTTQAKLDEANRAAADYARKTFFLRAHYAAWQEFIRHYPAIERQWEIFLAGGTRSTTAPSTTQELIDMEWPLSAMK
jgi:hypothetical protein